jgi:hypothetical protein
MFPGFLAVALAAALAATPADAGAASGRHSVWRRDCGPYGHRGPWGGCIPGGPLGAGNYYFLGPNYFSPWVYEGLPDYGEPPQTAEPRDYGPGYWGTRPYGIPAFQ